MGQRFAQGRGFVCISCVVVAAACLWICSHLSAAPQNKSTHLSSAPVASRPDILFVQASTIKSGALAQRFPQGSTIVRLPAADPRHTPLKLTDGFFAAADPQMNFDATKILFSAQKNQGERWQLWEMDLDGSHKRQITQCKEDCLRGAYLPADDIALTVEKAQENEQQSYLAVVKMDGSQLRRITFGPADFRLATVLRDGRIVASAPWPLQDDTASRTLYTLRPDGTALESLRCEHNRTAIQSDAAELADGSLVFVETSHSGTVTGGELMEIRRGDANSSVLGLRTRSYASPSQLPDEQLLFSEALSSPNGAEPKFDLYALSVKGRGPAERIFADAKLSSIQAIPVTPHPVPKHYWSTLDPESPTGYFISLDSHLSADAPGGRFNRAIAQVRVLTLNPIDGREQSLGKAPVESDGSFYVRVPANTPVRFILLDAKGQPIHEESSWIWARPGEQRGCTGCHGDKNVAPENHWPMTLKRFDTPTPLGDSEHVPATVTAK